MPSFFTSSPKKSPKQATAVFAGLDDPFNFPTNKMRYNTRSHPRTASPDSAHDSGYCSSASPDEDTPLSPRSQMPAKNRRRLHKDGTGHWRMHSYEYQSEHNDRCAEREPILHHDAVCMSTAKSTEREADNAHEWKPNLKHTFTFITGDVKGGKWYTSRVYGKKMLQREKNGEITDLQRSMAPVLRRPSPSPSPSPSASSSAVSSHQAHFPPPTRPHPGPRKQSTLLHPSPPIESETETNRGRPRNLPSLFVLQPSPASTSSPSNTHQNHPLRSEHALRSPRHRSPTPLAIPTSSVRQPTPTPLRIYMRRSVVKMDGMEGVEQRRGSVLHSCFSDSESESDGGSDSEIDLELEDGHGHGHANAHVCSTVYGKSEQSQWAGTEGEGVLARTARVARAQRVRVGARMPVRD